jgi:pimeloyl-ACP methyl ester carboxylesterase/DNA-binding CsgD family transcriptional regulator
LYHPARRAAQRKLQMKQQIRFCTSREGVRIAFATAGEGPPLVRVNNWFTHLELDWESPVWRHWSLALAERRMLVRYDPRGSGLSDRDVTEFSLDALVSDLESVVDALKLRRFPLIGLCQGGVIAAAYAARHPDRVSRLVLYDSYLHGAFTPDVPAPLAKQAQAFLQVIELGWGRKVGAFREMFAHLLMPDAAGSQLKWISEQQRRSASPETACRLWNAFNAFDVRAEASNIAAPTLVFHVRGDAMVPFEAGRRLAAAIPNARFVPLEGRNHILRADEPAWSIFRKELNDFLGADEQAGDSTADEIATLTTRERELLDCIARGLTNPQIADHLHISEKTVRNHVTSVFSKLGAEHRAQAIVIARKAGLGQ